MSATDTVQTWTEDGEIYTRLIDCSGRITEWNAAGMLCRQGCGEPAGIGTGGQCNICAGIDEPEEDRPMIEPTPMWRVTRTTDLGGIEIHTFATEAEANAFAECGAEIRPFASTEAADRCHQAPGHDGLHIGDRYHWNIR